MAFVLRALLALAVDLLICYLCGALILENFYIKISNAFSNTILGFLVVQSIFELITLGNYFLGGTLRTVTGIWCAVAGLVLILYVTSLFVRKRQTAVKYKVSIREVFPIVIAILTVAAFCYYVSVNGELNEDSRYYIGMVNTTVNTGTLFQYNPYNGVKGDAYYLRRALATYEIHSAVICKVFALPALVTTRIMRACENVILTSMATYLFGSRVLWKTDEKRMKNACYLVALNLIFQLMYAGTYPSSAMFFLIRAYEGKAFTANVIVIYIMYLSAEFVMNREKKYLVLLFLGLWGATAVSSSGTVVVGIEIGIFLAAYIGWCIIEKYRKQKYA